MAATLLVMSAGCNRANVDQFIRMKPTILALEHVRVIDGTGAPGRDDQTVIIEGGIIRAAGASALTPAPASATMVDLHDHTLIPGLVGMHDHLFYEIQLPSENATEVTAQEQFARLYLASGVTTIRTAGTVDLAGDLRIKHLIDEGERAGPEIYITSPYVSGGAGTPEQIDRQVARWAALGVTSLKAYTTLTTAELAALVNAAHHRGMTVAGHVCAVGFREAVSLGIDSLEHGLPFDTEFDSEKQRDECPDVWSVFRSLSHMAIAQPSIQRTINDMVGHGVRLTSTLAVIESFTSRGSVLDPRVPVLLAPALSARYEAARLAWTDSKSTGTAIWAAMLKKEMDFERSFVTAGGALMAGVDPTGWGGVFPGSGDHRGVELLVEAGFSPEQAIHIATLNGASFLKADREIGSIEPGKRADVVVIKGNLLQTISDIRNVELVVKDGVVYDPTKLADGLDGTVGRFEIGRYARSPVAPFGVVVAVALIARVTWRFTRRVRRSRR